MFGISFLVPAFLAGLAAAAVPIVLHLLKRETAPRLSFSAVHLIRRAPVEQISRRRLHELLLLALRVAALVLLALAFARPYLAGAVGADSAGVTVIAVDTSFSLSTPGRFDRARALAEQALRAAPRGDLVAVVAFDTASVTVVEPTPDRQFAAVAIGRLTPGFGGTRYATALARAAQVIGARTGHVVVVSDLQQSGWRGEEHDAIPRRISVEVADVGEPPGNLAVTAIHGGPVHTAALVFNAGPEAKTTRARLLIDGVDVDAATVTVPAGVTGEARFPVALPRAGEAQVVIEDREGFTADNVRYAVLSPPDPMIVAAVTDSANVAADAFYFDRALLAADDANRFDLTFLAGTRLSGLAAETPGEPAAVVLLTTRGLDRTSRAALRAFVERGGGLLIVMGPGVEPSMVTALLDEALIVSAAAEGVSGERRLIPADARHPIFRAFGERVGSLGQVRFTRTVPVEVAGAADVLARFNDGTPALVEHRIGAGRVLVFASGLENAWNDFPRHPTFVPFVHEMAKYVGRDREVRRDFVIGETPAGVPDEPGFATAAGSELRVAVNVDREESDPARMSALEFDSAVERMRGSADVTPAEVARDEEREQGYWRYGFGLMALVLAAESLLGSRMG